MPDAEHQSRQPRNSQPERLRRLCGDGSAQRMNHPSLKLWRPGTWTAPNRRRFLEKKGTGKETGSKLLETFGNQRLFDNTSGGVRERVESVLTPRATATPTRPASSLVRRRVRFASTSTALRSHAPASENAKNFACGKSRGAGSAPASPYILRKPELAAANPAPNLACHAVVTQCESTKGRQALLLQSNEVKWLRGNSFLSRFNNSTFHNNRQNLGRNHAASFITEKRSSGFAD